jgi:hypothetical protein
VARLQPLNGFVVCVTNVLQFLIDLLLLQLITVCAALTGWRGFHVGALLHVYVYDRDVCARDMQGVTAGRGVEPTRKPDLLFVALCPAHGLCALGCFTCSVATPQHAVCVLYVEAGFAVVPAPLSVVQTTTVMGFILSRIQLQRSSYWC